MAGAALSLRRRRWRASNEDGRKVVLHVGCGPLDHQSLYETFRGPEWREVRLDIDPAVKPDILGTIVNMERVESASVDAVWSSHNIEHVFTHEVPHVFAEFLRVLRPGGQVLLTTPDLQAAAEAIVRGRLEEPLYDSAAGRISPLDIVYGHLSYVAEGNEYMAHRTGFTASALARKLREAGFARVDVRRGEDDYALWAIAERPEVAEA
jgi:protein O-GlcNAc transferase